VEARFGSLDGVIRTRVGYTGGTTRNPTYRHLGDHTETVEIDFDPARVSYRDLLRVFWSSHNPGQQPWSRQYRAAVFYHDAGQQRLAEQTRAEVAARTGRPVFTDILPAGKFYLAEDYQQKYYLRYAPELLQEYRAIYPDIRDFVNSTAAARVNGFVAGHGSRAQLQQELDLLGLSPQGRKLLAQRATAARREGAQDICPVR
jgi:peptide-methionine (S)-S-oxide reductase